jgi:hypothetical protein
MPKGNFNNQTKRNRELAKKDKRAAKDEKRAQKKADARAARATVEGTPPSTSARAAMPVAPSSAPPIASSAVLRWMNKKPLGARR